MGLSDAEVASYHREGYVIPNVKLPEAEVKGLRAALDELIAKNPGVPTERLVSAHIEAKGGSGEATQGVSAFMELAKHPTILDAVEKLIGPDIILWGCQVFCKPGHTGMEVPMHQDGNYWPIRPLATCSVWLAIDRADKENGCLTIVPGSHIGRADIKHAKTDSGKVVLNQYIPEEELKKMRPAVDIELNPGEFSLHDVYTVHGSNANVSPRRRAGVALRYMPATSYFNRDLFKSDAASGYVVDWAKRPIFLLRGRDQTGKNVMAPGTPPSAKL